jgi:phosphoglycerol transferase MdoB-like AlkP superfamily enzyme
MPSALWTFQNVQTFRSIWKAWLPQITQYGRSMVEYITNVQGCFILAILSTLVLPVIGMYHPKQDRPDEPPKLFSFAATLLLDRI